MNKNLNLCQILKDCPKGTKLWSPVWGDVFLDEIKDSNCKPITLTAVGCNYIALYSSGKMYNIEESECILFPSKDQRDWNEFKIPNKRFDPGEFKPSDKVLVRDNNQQFWYLSTFVCLERGGVIIEDEDWWEQCIPFNDETSYLVDTNKDCSDYYKWWEE